MLLTILHCTMYTKWLWIVKDAEQPAAILLAVTCNHRADARRINHQQAAKYQRQNVPANVLAVYIQAVAKHLLVSLKSSLQPWWHHHDSNGQKKSGFTNNDT